MMRLSSDVDARSSFADAVAPRRGVGLAGRGAAYVLIHLIGLSSNLARSWGVPVGRRTGAARRDRGPGRPASGGAGRGCQRPRVGKPAGGDGVAGGSLSTALERMFEEGVEHILVVRDGELVGICTRTAVLRARHRQLDLERPQPGWRPPVPWHPA